MQLLFIVQSSAHKKSAGVRIRYDRLAAMGSNIAVTTQSLDELVIGDLVEADVCIFCKTYGTFAGLLAERLRQIGKVVGIDMFDDYFSQQDDPRLVRFRDWFRTHAGLFDFALCSTEVMRRVVLSYVPDLPTLLLPDPRPAATAGGLRRALEAKLARTRATGVIEAVWFGIGSNPFFAAGLRDLAAYSGSLAALERGRFVVNLTIVTDKASLTPDTLARLGRLPVSHRILDWSVESEAAALAEAFVSFLPVNGQAFSRAKTLNRALTAMAAGTQLLSPGFPLYAALDDFVYADAGEIIADLARGRCRINPDNVETVEKRMDDVSSVATLSGDLRTFLKRLLAGREERARTRGTAGGTPPIPAELALTHGANFEKRTAGLARAAGILLMKTPLTSVNGAFDLAVDYKGEADVDIWIRPDLRALVSFAYRASCTPPEKIGSHMMCRIAAAGASQLSRVPVISPDDSLWLLHETALYDDFLEDLQDLCRRVLPTVRISLANV